MKKLNLQEYASKEEMLKECKKHGITIKEVVLDRMHEVIDELFTIVLKIEKNERAVNEDWQKVAKSLQSIMNVLEKGWYLENPNDKSI